eukprot:g8375.t1
MKHPYRSHTCGALRLGAVDQKVKLSGWVHRKRDHGQLLFIDLRDHYGITQCVFQNDRACFQLAEKVAVESVVTIMGEVVQRSPETVNPQMATGKIEVVVETFELLSPASPLPLQVNSNGDFPEETRLTYRFLDLRRENLHNNIVLRSQVIARLRQQMSAQGFLEIQTPILTASSPEGARDYLVPSRVHPGKFYALPQAPQQFKQLLMVSGFDRYFQIAPCFRDEDGRADRSPGEFYQLDFEMAFATQEDVFGALEPVLYDVFSTFSDGKFVSQMPFRRLSYHDAMLYYGTDKPDLRNPLVIQDVTSIFDRSDFSLFAQEIEKGAIVRAIPGLGAASRPRRFFDEMNEWARSEGAGGLGYIVWHEGGARGPIAKFLDEERCKALQEKTKTGEGDILFFACGDKRDIPSFAGRARQRIGQSLDLIDQDRFALCWIVDFPLYEWDEKLQKIIFSHNPFSMPQGGLEALETQDPLEIKAYQYDIVCNGVELSSGAIRNHLPEVLFKAFGIAGYTREQVEQEFGGLLNAFHFGAPPHGGAAPGVDRIVMLLADAPNLREVTAFPMNQQAQDLLMGAPSVVSSAHLDELCLKVVRAESDKKKSPAVGG